MRIVLLLLMLLLNTLSFARQSFQLAPPMLKYPSSFFSGTTSFSIVFDQPGTEIHYTLNGKEPGLNDPIYKDPVPITKHTVVKAKAMGNGFLASETVSAEFIRDGKQIKQARYSIPNEYYSKANEDILFDNAGGQINYRSGGWVGFDKDTVEILIELKKKETINSVLLNLLQDENSWIFLPQQILLYYYDEKKAAYLPVGKEAIFHESPSPKACSLREIVPTKKITTNKLRLEIAVLKKIPDWHIAKGNHAWLFIDEIKVY